MNECEENFNEKKRKFKYEIKISDEQKELDVLDPANVEMIIKQSGIQLPQDANDNSVFEKFRTDLAKTVTSARKSKE